MILLHIITVERAIPIQNNMLYHKEFKTLSGIFIINPLVLEFLISIKAPIKQAIPSGNVHIGNDINDSPGIILINIPKKNKGIPNATSNSSI